MVLLVGFSSCPVFGPRDYTRCCIGILLHRTSHWFSLPRFRIWLQTCRVSDFCFFFTSLVLRRYLSYSRPRNCRFLPPAVFRSSLLRFLNRPQRRRDVISLALLLHYVAPGRARWNVSVFCYPFSCSTNKPVEGMSPFSAFVYFYNCLGISSAFVLGSCIFLQHWL